MAPRRVLATLGERRPQVAEIAPVVAHFSTADRSARDTLSPEQICVLSAGDSLAKTTDCDCQTDA